MTTRLVKVIPEAAIFWSDTGSSPTELFTATSLASGFGRQGAYHDFTTAARALQWGWRARLVPGATRVVGEIIRVYWITSDGTHPDNDDGTGDIAVSDEDKLRNIDQIGSFQIDEDAAVKMVIHGDFPLIHRHGAPAMFNATANTLSATAADFGFHMFPLPGQLQAEV